jgi:hypothetical protein
MRCLLRSVACLMVLAGPPAPHSLQTFNNSPAFPVTARILLRASTFDLQKNDPQRKVCVRPPDDVPRLSGRQLDDHILKYLRKMIGICRRKNRRDMVWYYQEAWELASDRIYGTLPPRENLSGAIGYQPENLPLPIAAGPAPEMRSRPLRKIVKLVIRPYRTWTLTYEQLECGHELLKPDGYSVPATRRRCAACAREALSKKKKPAATVAAIARSKAVGA